MCQQRLKALEHRELSSDYELQLLRAKKMSRKTSLHPTKDFGQR